MSTLRKGRCLSVYDSNGFLISQEALKEANRYMHVRLLR